MRIAYVLFWDAYRDSGVLKKVQAFVLSLREAGAECRLFAVSTNALGRDPALRIEGAEIVCHPRFRRVREHTGAALFARMASFPLLARRLREYGPDIVYYRLGIWMPGITWTLKSAAPFVIEVNTDNDKEAAHWDLLRRTLYRATRTFVPASAAGIVSVSGEIARIYERYRKPIFIMSNGCHGAFRSRPLPPAVSLVFVGSPGQAWQGVDRVADMARRFPAWTFHIVGEELEGGPPNLVVHGYLEGEALRRVQEGATVGIGTLALHRKGMEEASPLKVREYLQAGLPVIIGYRDTDLRGAPWCLEIPNRESGVEESLERIRAFVEGAAAGRIAVDASDAEARVSYGPKASGLLRFLEGLKG